MPDSFLYTLRGNKLPEHTGGKAVQIFHLMSTRVRVPVTHVCVWDAREAYLEEKAPILATIKREIVEKLDLSKAYAVRSSANFEDSSDYSFAGQFLTVLDVKGLENLLEAIQAVWASAQSPSLQAYLAGLGIEPAQLRMAVILQEMVDPVVSGVAFSKNPMTGLDEIVVEAVPGSGEALMQDGVTPDRWVSKWGAWTHQPEQTRIDQAIIAEVVAQTKAIAAAFKRPLDLEWVFSGAAIHWVQLREITTGDDINIYSNRISREVLPGIIKPLVWSVNIPLVNSAWIALLTELIGPNNGIEPNDLSKAFYYRAYFNMGVLGRIFEALGMPKETLELMMGMQGGNETPKFRPSRKVLKHLPRMLKFTLDKLRYSREIETLLPEMDLTYAAFAGKPIDKMDEAALLITLNELISYTRQAAYMNIVGPLLMLIYTGIFRRTLLRADIHHEDFDVTHGLLEIEQYDPNAQLDSLHHRFRLLDTSLQERIRAGSYIDFQASTCVPEDFKKAVVEFIDHFGHLSESGNDFSRVPWREQQDLALNLILNRDDGPHHLLAGQNNNNHDSNRVVNWETMPLSRAAKWRMRWQYQRARSFRLYRESISFRYTYGYGLIRNYVLALAASFVQRGILAKKDDIFYLYMDEVRAIVSGKSDADFDALALSRRQNISKVEEIVLPDVIYGDIVPPPETQDESRKRLLGIPTSGGYCRGPICVVRDLSEFGKMRAGAILVIPYSDIAWTPLFAGAGAVIAESGGILSHSSIVAREYRVPAVVSVTGACHLLKDGMMATVDGYKGEVSIDSN